MAAFEGEKAKLAGRGVAVYAASVDSEEDSARVAEEGFSHPLAYGISRETADRIGAWWDEKRSFVQPAEFVISEGGRILHSSYSSGPLGRTDPGDVVSMLEFLEKRRQKKPEARE